MGWIQRVKKMRGGIRRENRGESREKTKRQVFGMGNHFEHLP